MNTTVFEAHNASELLTYLKAKEDYIVVKNEYSKEVYELIKSHLSETEMMGFDLGSGGTLRVLADLINTFRDYIKNEPDVDKTTKAIEKKLRLYKVQVASKEEIVLKLKQLEY